MTTEDFLDQVYLNTDQRDLCMDLIFDHINDLLLQGDFETCDEILEQLEIDKLSPCLMISFLTITVAARSKLKERNNLFHLMQQNIMQQNLPEGLLKGLE